MEKCGTCDREFNKNCEHCEGKGRYGDFNQNCRCCECGKAKDLCWGDNEGVIQVTSDGEMITNQTGGVCCHHPLVRGIFRPCLLPQIIKDSCYDKWYISDNDVEKLNKELSKVGYPYEITGGEEAWLECIDINGNNCVLTWPNSD